MATNLPYQLNDQDWHSVQAGSFSGAIQNVGNSPLVGFVAADEDGAPDEGQGGFAIGSDPTPIQIAVGETLYVRTTGTRGAVILA